MRILIGYLLALASFAAQADALVGQRLFEGICSTCHGSDPTASNFQRAAASPNGVDTALSTVGAMRPLRNNLSGADITGLQEFFVAVNVRPVPLRPQRGVYWNPAQSGRGFAVEVGGDTIAIGAYYYMPDGRATWSVGVGALQQSRLLTNLDVQRGGQTLVGAWRPAAPAGTAGEIEVIVTSERSIALRGPGGWVMLERVSLWENGTLPEPRGNRIEAGYWWAPEEAGRGFVLEVQGDRVFLGGYMYDAAGDSVWYLAQGTLDAATDRFAATWLRFGGGQTLAGPWRPAQLIDPAVGALQVEFDTPRSATLVLPDGRRQRIVRFF